MNFFETLRAHGRETPDRVATSSPRHRLTTFRKLWSRIERSSARMQGEWLVEAGDVVIYAGHAHPDALVLWLALARLGAVLMPLESAAMIARAGAIAEQHDARLLLHDDDMPAPQSGGFCACLPLSTLFASRCDHEARECRESTADISLLQLDPEAPHAQQAKFSIDSLLDHAGAPAAWPAADALFDPQRLRQQILPALAQGLPLALA